MHRNTCTALLFGMLFSVLLFIMPGKSYAADLLLSPAANSSAVGKEFSVKVLVDPGDKKVNAADGTLSFDKDVLQVTNVSKEGSVFSLWTADPTFSNGDGTVTFSGGTPSAFTTKGTVVTITFKGKKVGTGSVTFSKGSVLAADGKGTNVYGKGMEGSYVITEAAAEPPPPPPGSDSQDSGVAGDSGPTPLAPVINSSTHPKPDDWYGTTTAQFNWRLPPDATGVRMLFSDKDDATPNTVLKPGATSTIVTGIKDGTSYFYLQFKNDSGWGEVAKRKVNVDTAPPEEFDIALLSDDKNKDAPKLSFQAKDDLSGIDRYDVIIGGTSTTTVKAAELAEGTYPVPPQDGGPELVTIKAYDKASNSREVKKQLTLPKVAKPTPKGKEEAPAPSSPWTLERILLILFALVIGALGSWYMSQKKNAEKGRSSLVKLVAEVSDKNDKVFSAMREEFEQMIKDFDVKPQLTPEERDLLERIKEVLDISEEIIDTGMAELRKIIREF